ncbi:PglZ domain-containing protein, partial [Candidatus Kryptobacter tengchongensis]
MKERKGHILWIDDEIELLRSHILFLEQKGYDVSIATNGDDAIEFLREKGKDIDLILLDEIMPGKGGLQTLSEIKELFPGIPVVMVTKNEEESLMEDAIGYKISDYLTKPVNPSQILMVCKKFIEAKKITSEKLTIEYLQGFRAIENALMTELDYQDWIEIYLRLTKWDIELDEHPELGLRESLFEQKRRCNIEFGKYIEKNYPEWIESENRPMLSVDVVERYLIPEIEDGNCMRLDQWIMMERELHDYFIVERQYYYSILPTATPYSRNAIFSGLFPIEIEKRFPELWEGNEDEERSRNKYEREFLEDLLQRKKIKLKSKVRYFKIIDPDFGLGVEQNITSYAQGQLTAIVVNFVDMLAHSRSD